MHIRHSPVRSRLARAFTLTELMVVIGIIAILAGLLLPVLSRGKDKALMIKCMSNNKQLVLAWRMFLDEHDDKLPGNYVGQNAKGKYRGNTNLTWCLGYLNVFEDTSADNTDVSLLKTSQLGPYANSPEIFKCPSDKSPLIRSYSMNCYLGPNVGGPNTAGYTQFIRTSNFRDMSPSSIFVFIDERSDGINDGSFLVNMSGSEPRNPSAYTLDNYPAFYHRNGATLSFADGHASSQLWSDSRTMPAKISGSAASPNNNDVRWLQDHSTFKAAP